MCWRWSEQGTKRETASDKMSEAVSRYRFKSLPAAGLPQWGKSHTIHRGQGQHRCRDHGCHPHPRPPCRCSARCGCNIADNKVRFHSSQYIYSCSANPDLPKPTALCKNLPTVHYSFLQVQEIEKSSHPTQQDFLLLSMSSQAPVISSLT